jgi:hypothetical protein
LLVASVFEVQDTVGLVQASFLKHGIEFPLYPAHIADVPE